MRTIRDEAPEGERWGVLEGDGARAIRGSLLVGPGDAKVHPRRLARLDDASELP